MTIVSLCLLARATMTKCHILGRYPTEIHLPTVPILEAKSPKAKCHGFVSLGLQRAIFQFLFFPRDFTLLEKIQSVFSELTRLINSNYGWQNLMDAHHIYTADDKFVFLNALNQAQGLI